jgi:ABC-2 type transport system ATP-binding protein
MNQLIAGSSDEVMVVGSDRIESASSPGSGIHCRSLSIRFGRTQALAGMTLEIAEGEAVGIIGRNGCGKSTLFRCIVGLEVPDQGHVEIGGGLSRLQWLEMLGFVPDTLSAYDWMSCGQAIEFVAAHQPRFDPGWCRELERLLAIDRKAVVRSLSRGMQARLAMVLGLLHNPQYVLLDEPLLGVDVLTQDLALEALSRLRSRAGTTMLIASHQVGDLARIVRESVAAESLMGGTLRVLVRGVPRDWTPPFEVVLSRWIDGAAVLTVEGDAVLVECAIRSQFPDAVVQYLPLSIHDACADRLRAMEVH